MNKKNSSTAEPNTAQNADPEIAYQANLAGTLCLISCFKSQWVIDSGATDHFCNNLKLFNDVRPFKGSIMIPDGNKIEICHIGSVRLNTDIVLSNVLHAPSFHFNLFSVTKFCLAIPALCISLIMLAIFRGTP